MKMISTDKVFTNQDLPLAKYYRNRSGYERCTYMIEGSHTISEKSSRYHELKDSVPVLPVVVCKELDRFTVCLEEIIIQYTCTFRKARTLIKWFHKNHITMIDADYDSEGECLTLVVNKPEGIEIA